MNNRIIRLELLDANEIEEKLIEILKTKNWSVVVTLVDGEMLFGDLNPETIQISNNEMSNEGVWVPERARKLPKEWQYGYKLRPVRIQFNSKAGTVNGRSHIIEIEDRPISDIRPLNWSKESTSFQYLKNVPNPLASLIFEHNYKVAEKYDLKIGEMLELALPRESIPSEEIKFNRSEIIYIDWNHLQHERGGLNLSVNITVGNIGYTRSLYRIAFDKLKEGRILGRISEILSSCPLHELKIRGYVISLKTELTTELKGESCFVVICSEEPVTFSEAKSIPVLLKNNALSYPREFLPFIKSKLMFYGDIKQILLVVDGCKFDHVLIARVIGYIDED